MTDSYVLREAVTCGHLRLRLLPDANFYHERVRVMALKK